MARFSIRTAVACLAVLCTSAIASADLITLSTTIRDFKDTHPDFEHVIASDPGYTSTTLGVDSKPVYTAGLASTTTTGATNYNQWYRDVPGVNKSMKYDLTLSNGKAQPGGVYSYCNNYFFPIDGILFGNQGRSHNYHFTLELHHAFTYQPGMWFGTTADDDLLLYINGLKVIDLGGVHMPQYGFVNLDGLGLVAGNSYSFDLFFAERHTSISNLCFDTSINFAPEPGTIILLAFGAISMVARRKARRS